MRELEHAELKLRDRHGVVRGTFTIHVAPSRNPSTSVELRLDNESDGLEPFQLMEGGEYRYSIDVPGTNALRVEPREVVYPDDGRGRSGRLRPGLYVGRLVLHVVDDVGSFGEAAVEVRSRKLNYLDEYRWMLGDISDLAAELALQRFAATHQRMSVDASTDASTLYQRFCFLKSVILGERMQHAWALIVARPHAEWCPDDHELPPGRGAHGSGELARSIARATNRVAWDHSWHQSIRSLPAKIPRQRFDPSRDTPPNRFVRHVLEEWRARVEKVHDCLLEERLASMQSRRSEPAAIGRGLEETRDVAEELDKFLSDPVLRGVGHLAHMPVANQVLQRRAGYREIRELYALSEVAGAIDWQGGEHVYGAGQRNVANLYEYWVYLQLARIIRDVTAGAIALDGLLKTRADGMSLGLRQQQASALKGVIERNGVAMQIELSFNREFTSTVSGGSWTQTMRPDVSLAIGPVLNDPLVETISLHFDAKYRVDLSTGLAGAVEKEAKVDDLVKMHAYRDAIVHAVGAYVVYPGDRNEEPFRKFTDIVPGIGAFALTPGANETHGASDLARFIGDVITHVCMRGSRRARATFWESQAYRGAGSHAPHVPRWIDQPPADVIVLLGHVKNDEHLAWIRKHSLYNLRADERRGSVPINSDALRARVLILHGTALGGRTEAFLIGDDRRVMTCEELEAREYPDPGGRVYFVLSLSSTPSAFEISGKALRRYVRERSVVEGAPITLTYLELIEAIGICGLPGGDLGLPPA